MLEKACSAPCHSVCFWTGKSQRLFYQFGFDLVQLQRRWWFWDGFWWPDRDDWGRSWWTARQQWNYWESLGHQAWKKRRCVALEKDFISDFSHALSVSRQLVQCFCDFEAFQWGSGLFQCSSRFHLCLLFLPSSSFCKNLPLKNLKCQVYVLGSFLLACTHFKDAVIVLQVLAFLFLKK